MELTNNILNYRAEPVGFMHPENLRIFTDHLLDVMRQHRGIGLAAPQVGIGIRIFVMEIGPKIFRCFNPEIIDRSKETTILNEGCLSFPNETHEIERHNWITAQWQNLIGNVIIERLDGIAARCFQHELDHLNGITIREKKNGITK